MILMKLILMKKPRAWFIHTYINTFQHFFSFLVRL